MIERFGSKELTESLHLIANCTGDCDDLERLRDLVTAFFDELAYLANATSRTLSARSRKQYRRWWREGCQTLYFFHERVREALLTADITLCADDFKFVLEVWTPRIAVMRGWLHERRIRNERKGYAA